MNPPYFPPPEHHIREVVNLLKQTYETALDVDIRSKLDEIALTGARWHHKVASAVTDLFADDPVGYKFKARFTSDLKSLRGSVTVGAVVDEMIVMAMWKGLCTAVPHGGLLQAVGDALVVDDARSALHRELINEGFSVDSGANLKDMKRGFYSNDEAKEASEDLFRTMAVLLGYTKSLSATKEESSQPGNLDFVTLFPYRLRRAEKELSTFQIKLHALREYLETMEDRAKFLSHQITSANRGFAENMKTNIAGTLQAVHNQGYEQGWNYLKLGQGAGNPIEATFDFERAKQGKPAEAVSKCLAVLSLQAWSTGYNAGVKAKTGNDEWVLA